MRLPVLILIVIHCVLTWQSHADERALAGHIPSQLSDSPTKPPVTEREVNRLKGLYQFSLRSNEIPGQYKVKLVAGLRAWNVRSSIYYPPNWSNVEPILTVTEGYQYLSVAEDSAQFNCLRNQYVELAKLFDQKTSGLATYLKETKVKFVKVELSDDRQKDLAIEAEQNVGLSAIDTRLAEWTLWDRASDDTVSKSLHGESLVIYIVLKKDSTCKVVPAEHILSDLDLMKNNRFNPTVELPAVDRSPRKAQ